MDRRSLLTGAAAAGISRTIPLSARAAGFCRARPGDRRWPTGAAWAALKASVGGALTRPVSPYEACKAESDGCFKLLRNPFYLGDQPGGTQVAGWSPR